LLLADTISVALFRVERQDLHRLRVEFCESSKLVYYGEQAVLVICNVVLIFAAEFESSACLSPL
jgi:hypothetical protein